MRRALRVCGATSCLLRVQVPHTVTGTDIPQLDEYLASNEPWRETEALAAIRAYQAERAAKKAASRS